jgi:hypothetical protein
MAKASERYGTSIIIKTYKVSFAVVWSPDQRRYRLKVHRLETGCFYVVYAVGQEISRRFFNYLHLRS